MIKISLVGGLGNQLYQYSACRSIAKKQGVNFYVDCSGYSLNYHFGGDGKEREIVNLFSIDVGKEDSYVKWNYYESKKGKTIITGPIPMMMDSFSDSFNDDNIENIVNSILSKIKDDTQLNGFFPNSFYFKENVDEINEWFQFKTEDYQILDIYSPDEYCYIHFRGGDFYQYFKDDEHFLTELYYRNAIKYVDNKKFVIFTNDVKLAKEYFKWMKTENIEHVILNNSIELDFFTLTRAKNFIGSYSSYSEWAGYLNADKKNSLLIYPSNIKTQFYKFKYFKYLIKNNGGYTLQ